VGLPTSCGTKSRKTRENGAGGNGVVFAFSSLPADRKNVTATARATDRRTPAALAVLAALLLVAAIVPATRPAGLLRDFDAFYCAGQAVEAGADPYRAEPLGACERSAKPAPLLMGSANLAMPAPLPPYALAPFVALARLPYVFAAVTWTLLLALSVAVTVAALRALTGLPVAVLAFGFLLGDGYASLALGQIAPLAIGAIAVAAWLLATGRDELAACAAGIAMLEPHVGLPVCASLFAWRARTRWPLAGIAVALGCLSVAVAGTATLFEYIRDVVPAHALSEIANEKQFSLTYALARSHVPDAIALHAGEVWYAISAAVSIWAAGRIARSGGNAHLATIPAAFAVFGGPFVHISQIAAALPAAFLLYARAPERRLGIAIVALAIPWIQFANLGSIFVPLAALAAGFLALELVDPRPATAAIAAGSAVLLLEIAIALVGNIPDASGALAAHYDPRALAEASWALYVRTIGTANAAAFDFAKLPTIAALCFIVCATLVDASRRSATTQAQTLAAGGNGAAVSRRIATL
jgi:hypothetical protein